MAGMVYVVTSNSDDISDTGSLRYALSQANTGDTITFSPNLTGGSQTIQLTDTLNVTHGVTIDGGTSNVVIDGYGNSSSGNGNSGFANFTINSGAPQVTIENLAINNGYEKGAKGASGTADHPDGGAGGDAAGGIFVQSGNLNLVNDSFANDTAMGGTGGSGYSDPNTNGAKGAGGNAAGAVYVEPGATVKASGLSFSGNSATGGISEPNGTGGGQGYPDSNDAAVCYASGTLIRTVRGEIAVDDLNVGDLAITASGKARPIRWLGHRTTDCGARNQPRDVWPIRVAANAFGDGLPSTDLFLSAGHSVQVAVMDEVLIPIGKLINGATIARHPVDQVTYWHVELETHDVLIANGLPAESFLDCGNREGLVEREGDYDRLADPHTPDEFCRPYFDAGPVVDAVRERLALRAAVLGWTRTRDVDLHLVVDGKRIDPDVAGTIARFVFPASAQHVTLASATQVPSDEADVNDHRCLGVSIHGLEIEDGLSDRVQLSLDDGRLAGAWQKGEAEAGCLHRFTDGHLPLSPSLWADCRGQVLLRVHHDPQGAARWVVPSTLPNVGLEYGGSADRGQAS